jgi:protein O-mannosyl-transferase
MWENDPQRARPDPRLTWAAALLVATTVLAYLPAFRGGFVFDDIPFLVQNTRIREIGGLFSFWSSTRQTDFWPVTYTAFWMEWRLWGSNPAGYHAVNIALHASEALLLWAVLRRLRIPGAYLAAFLFAVHPVNVESVAWIIQLKNLMAMLFLLLAAWWFAGSAALRGEGADRSYALSLAAFVLAMLSKGSAAVLPLVLLGIVLSRRRPAARDLAVLAPFFAVAGLLAATDVWFQKHGLDEVFRSAGFAERLAGAGAVVWFYLWKALAPVGLLFVYPQWNVRPGDLLWWAPLAGAAALTALLWRNRGGWARQPLFAWGYYCAALLPVMGFTDVYFMKFSLVADHYQHIALVGVASLAGAAWSRWEAVAARAARAAAVAVIAILACLTWRQCGIYRDSETLWTSVLRGNPGCLLAQNNLGNSLLSSGRTQDALERYREEIRVDPGYADAHNNLGMVLAGQGRLAEARAEVETALRLQPNSPPALVNLATILQKQGLEFEARRALEKALRLDPDDADAHMGMGVLMAASGETSDAVREFRDAVRLRPDSWDAFENLGNALGILGRPEEAQAAYRSALKGKPRDAALHARLAAVLGDGGRIPEAAEQYAQSLRLDPGVPEVHYNLGALLAQSGDLAGALREFGEAVRLRPGYAEAHANLGVALVNTGRLADAAAELERAVSLNPGLGQVRRNLAQVLHALGRDDEARAQLEPAGGSP